MTKKNGKRPLSSANAVIKSSCPNRRIRAKQSRESRVNEHEKKQTKNVEETQRSAFLHSDCPAEWIHLTHCFPNLSMVF
jgi:hypothetical protein